MFVPVSAITIPETEESSPLHRTCCAFLSVTLREVKVVCKV